MSLKYTWRLFKVMTLTQEYALDGFYLSNCHLLPEGTKSVLQEGAVDVAKDAIQFVVAAATEYGFVVTVGGAPAGPVIETIVDAAFVSEGVASTAIALGQVASSFNELKDLMTKVMSVNLSAGFDAFYQQILEIWRNAAKFVGAEFRDKIDEMVEKAQKILKKLITKLADTATDTIKLIIPDAVIGTAIAEALEAALKALAANAYTISTGVLDKTGQFKEILIDPAKTRKFFTDAFDWLEETLKKIIEAREKDPEGVIATIASLAKKANPTLEVVDQLSGIALTTLQGFVANNKDQVIDTVVTVSKVIIPGMFALLASYEILMKGEWKTEDANEEEEAQQESYAPEYLLKPTRAGKYAAAALSRTLTCRPPCWSSRTSGLRFAGYGLHY